MVQYSSDQNKVAFRYESGAYANALATDQPIGLVQSNNIDESEGVIPIRYAGTSSRNVGMFVPGARDYTGTLTYFPQDYKFLVYALGKCTDAGSPSPYTHTITEMNGNETDAYTTGNFPSFTIYDGKGIYIAESGLNFNRLINGCKADSFTLSASEGETITAELSYIGQTCTFSSGTAPAPTLLTSRPFVWSDAVWSLPSGTTIPKVKNWTFSISNNLDIPHYSNGSRVIGEPMPTIRDYEVSLTLNMDTSNAKSFYDTYFLGGSTFNMLLNITDTSAGTGSRYANITFSGCKLIDMETPTAVTDIQEQTLTITPQVTSAIVEDTIEKYNAW